MKSYRYSIKLVAFFSMMFGGLLLSSNMLYTTKANDFVEDLLKKLDLFHKEIPEDRVYLHFDKTMYKPGETIWFSAYMRNGSSLKPSQKSDIMHVELINPKGGIEKKLNLVGKKGKASGDFFIDSEAPGGMYKVKAYTQWQNNDPDPAYFVKEIQVQKVILPRLKMKLDFEKEAYGPGDEVTVELSIHNNENTALGNYPFDYIVNIDGDQIISSSSHTGSSGEALLRFQLPLKLNSNDGLVNVITDYQGQPESISRSVPIVLNAIDLALYPEGGDLVTGLPSRVAFKAVNEFGKPADIEATLLDERGVIITHFKSYHQGMGAFEFTPQKNSHYEVAITSPKNVESRYALPKALSRGYGLGIKSIDDRYLRLNLHSTEVDKMTVMVNVRGKNYAATSMDIKEGRNPLTVPLRNMPAGVAQVTLFDSKGVARAERLVFVNKNRQLNIKVKTDKEQYQPREKVKMNIEVTDERGLPMPADLSVAVADDQLLSFVDDKSSNILSWLLMEADLADEVYEPEFYFNPKEEKADLALDFLLMTSGWRRFTWKQVQEDVPVVSVAAKQAVIGGIVLDRRGFPMANALVEVSGANMNQRTDENGLFKFYGVELFEPQKILVKGGENLTNSLLVNAYADNLKIWAVPNKLYVKDLDGEGIPFANVLLKGTHLGVNTDFDGKADIGKLAEHPDTKTLVISYVGYNTREIDLNSAIVSKKGEIEVVMESSHLLMESVVIGSGRGAAAKPRPKKSKNRNMAEMEMAPPPPPAPAVEEIFMMEAVDEDAVKFAIDNVAPAAIVVDKEKEMDLKEEKLDEEAGAQNREEFKAGFVFDDRMLARGKDRDDKKPVVPAVKYYQAREFAAPMYEKPVKTEERTDFRSTLYWNNRVEIDRSGKATLEFYTSDAITSFNITVEGIASDGMVGRSEKKFFTQLPFSLSAKIPVEVLTEDVIRFPLTVVNNTNEMVNGQLDIFLPKGFLPKGNLPKVIHLNPKEAKTIFLESVASEAVKESELIVKFNSGQGFSDAFRQPVSVVSKGFPASLDFSGHTMSNSYPVDIREVVDGTLDVSVTAYPSTVSELMSGLESMLREPHGCFEQTSSSTYPNILVLQYLKASGQDNPEVSARAKELIKRGYKRLVSFESPNNGFEWFGGDPAHEGLTAYGLMEFIDMKKIYSGVDDAMVERTINWLMSRRDGKGLFQRNPRALHQFGLTDNETMSAYITYALSEAGYTDLKIEADASFKNAMKAKSPYLLGLAANTLYNYGDAQRGKQLLEELMSIQLENGSWEEQGKSISAPGSSGVAYRVETAALALLAMMKDNTPHMASVKKVADFLGNSRGGYGGFGNTNSTVLALKALVEYAGFLKRTDESGTIRFFVDGKEVMDRYYEKGTKEPIIMDGLEAYVKNGKQKLDVVFEGVKQPLPYTLAVRWRTALPNSDPACAIKLETRLGDTRVKLGETVRLTTLLENKSAEGQPMTIAVVGIPAGLSVQPWQLKELLDKKKVDFYEVIGNNVVFYYRQMAPSEKHNLHLDLKADIAGTFYAPASSAYLYYTNEHKDWTSTNAIIVVE